MPVYNGARYLERSCAVSPEPNGGELRSPHIGQLLHGRDSQICERLAAEDPRIVYTRQERDIGATRNFEYLLRAAHTPFFMWAAHDDTWEPEFLAETLALLRRFPDAVGCAVGLQGLIPESGVTWRIAAPISLSSPSPAIRARAAFRAGVYAVYGLYRRDALEIGDPVINEVHFADGLFVFRMALHGKFAVSNRTLQVFRDVDQQAKATGSEAHLYSGSFTAASRLMWRFAGQAALSRWEVASLRGYILWKWFAFTRDWAARVNLQRGSEAWRARRYPQLMILSRQLFLRPSDLVQQSRRRLGLRFEPD